MDEFEIISPKKFKTCHIPKIIHQMWKDENVPVQWEESPREWKRLFPDWEYKFWTDKTMREFMEKHYPDFLETYDNYEYPIQRSDSFRYHILEFEGGIYSDLDIVPTSNFTWFFENTDAEVYLPMTQNILSFTNCIMASKRNAPFWKHVQKWLKIRAGKWYICAHFTVIFQCGPQLLTKSVETYNKPIGLLPRNIISQDMTNPHIKNNEYTLALFGRSWNRWDSHLLGFFYINRKTFYQLVFVLLIYWIYLFFLYRSNYMEYHLVD
jgi:mannosyltransferase OCH1-like enzyme